MDCCICTSLPHILRLPRNTICDNCFKGAKSMTSMLNQQLHLTENPIHQSNDSLFTQPNLPKQTLSDISKWVSNMKDELDEQSLKIKFLSEFVVAFKDQIHTDILLKPGNYDHPLPAHKSLLAIRSEIFKNMLDSDGCKAPPNDNTITLAELKYEELESLLEFLYKGSLSEEKMKKHIICLSLAADKYHITYLQKMCERHMLMFLNSSNVLDVLEMSNNVCSYQTLKESAFNFIVKNIQDIVCSSAFDVFTYKNPHLSVQIMRASFKDDKKSSHF